VLADNQSCQLFTRDAFGHRPSQPFLSISPPVFLRTRNFPPPETTRRRSSTGPPPPFFNSPPPPSSVLSFFPPSWSFQSPPFRPRITIRSRALTIEGRIRNFPLDRPSRMPEHQAGLPPFPPTPRRGLGHLRSLLSRGFFRVVPTASAAPHPSPSGPHLTALFRSRAPLYCGPAPVGAPFLLRATLSF